MVSKFFSDCIKKQKYGIVIYPNDLFELRVQEEMIRADEYKSFFVYVEMDFRAIRAALPSDEEEKFWRAVFSSFATKGRGSDVVGFLENKSGIGLILLDSKMEGWRRLAGRFKEFAKDSVTDIQRPLDTVKALVYPAYIEASAAKVSGVAL